MLRVVIDTNVFISGLFKTSRLCKTIIRKFSTANFELVISPAILEELIGVLRRPKFRDLIVKETAEKFIEVIRGQAILVKPPKSINVIKEDPADNRFLEAGTLNKVDFIVSGDRHLLSLKTFKGIPIIPPKEFVKLLKTS